MKHDSLTQLSFLGMLDTSPLLPSIVMTGDRRWSDCKEELATAKHITLDLETANTKAGNGLDPDRGQIRLIQVYLPTSKLVMIYDLFKDADSEFINLFLDRVANPECSIGGANLLFDLRWLKAKYNVLGCNIRDIMILSQTLWAGIKTYRHSLAAIYKRLFDQELSKEQQRSNWNEPNLSNTQLNYAATDVIATYKCLVSLSHMFAAYDSMPSVMGNKCTNTLQEIALIECDAIGAFVEISLTGIPINIDYANKVIDRYQKAIADLFAPVGKKLGLPYSANSEKLVKAIYHEYGIWLITEDPKKKGQSLEDDEYDLDEDSIISVKQVKTLFAEFDYPPIPINHVISSGSATLFDFYITTGESDLLVLSLARSLKKCLDSLISLRDSALQNGGYARASYRSLGGTSTGRSTSGGDKKSTLIALNLQNLPNEVSHPLIAKYKLPAPRTIIQANSGKKLSIIDLSAAHSRYCAKFSNDVTLIESLSMKDPHLLMTSKILSMVSGKEYSVQDLIDRGGKKDAEIAEYRSIAKTYYYLALNCGGAKRAQQAFLKYFQTVSLENCELAGVAFKETFPEVVKYQRTLLSRASRNMIDVKVQLKNGHAYTQKYARFRTDDGRLIHLPCYANKQDKKGNDIFQPKISDCTSCMMISAEAIAEKKSLTQVVNILSQHPNQKLLNFVHDELVLEVTDDDKGVAFAKAVFEINAAEFTTSLLPVPSGMVATDKAVSDTICNNYSEK